MGNSIRNTTGKSSASKRRGEAYGNNEQGRRTDRTERGGKRTTRSERAAGYGREERYSRDERPTRVERAAKSLNRTAENNENPNLLIGRNPISEAIKAGRPIDKILMQRDLQGSAKAIAAEAREMGVQVQIVDKIVLDKLAPGRPHQGIAAYVAAHSYVGVEDILAAAKKKGEDPLIVILDGLEDPHNLGAILRSCDGAGAHGVIIPSRRSVSLTETVAKASAGAIEYVPVAKTGNLSQTIELLKKKGLWIAAVDMDGSNYSEAKLEGPMAIVIGGEGSGVSRIVRDKSDFIVSIPMKGHVNSLNASNAAAIVLYEAARQRG